MKRRALQLEQKNGERYALLRYGIAQNTIVCTWDARKLKHKTFFLSLYQGSRCQKILLIQVSGCPMPSFISFN